MLPEVGLVGDGLFLLDLGQFTTYVKDSPSAPPPALEGL